MAEIAATFIGPVIELVVKWVGAPIMRQFNYLCCFTSNITSLKNDAEKLKRKAEDLQSRVDDERNNVRVIFKEVDNLLENSKNTIEETDGILKEAPNVKSGCLKFSARYFLSKRAKKTSDLLKELQEEYKFDAVAIACAGPPAATQPVPDPTEATHEFESRKRIEEEIMTTLESGDVNMIGIYGMGGLGKTTMATRIMNRALEERIFDKVVMVTVSQSVDKLRIQVEIGGPLGLKLQEETPQTRVHKLHERLSDDTDRILLVLDDVWEELELVSLGIPLNHKKCKILLTSRNRDVLGRMDVEKYFGMELLSKEDARLLFEQTVGEYAKDTKLSSIAKEIVNRCGGLPLALKIVGSTLKGKMAGNALKDKSKVSIWKDTLRQMKNCNPKIPGILADVYNPLKLSYNFLDPKQKFVFLVCCLYPEDADISLEHLTYFSMGLDIFEGDITNVEEARDNICSLASMLISRSLLLDSKRGDDYVRMHDVVRDFCIFIAKEEKYIGDNHCSRISSFQRIVRTSGLPSQELRLVFWRRSYSENEESNVDSSFLGDMNDLYVLCIENDSFTSLPFTTQSLKNLKTLVIDSIRNLKTLSSVGELVSLEILICHNCLWLEELPPEMKGLTRLKVLDLTGCISLQRIGRDIISSLVGLEELKMLKSFKNWEVDDREERVNARVRELGALEKLKCLEIEIVDPALAAENMRLSSKLERFYIKLNKKPFRPFHFDRYDKKLNLLWDEESRLGDWIEMQLLRNTECLLLSGSGANNVDLARAENIKALKLGECERMEKMVTTSMDDGGASHVLSSIEYLFLYDLPKLEEILDGPIWWLNLKKLEFDNLPALKQLWQSYNVHLEKNYLPQLETLIIQRCEKMEQVFKWDGNENNLCHHMLFPKLKVVELWYLPNLTSFYHGIQGIEFPQLTNLSIGRCRKLNWMVSDGNKNNSGGGNNSNAHIHHPLNQPQEVSLRCLKELKTNWTLFAGRITHASVFNGLEVLVISEYEGSMSLFSSSITGALVNLTSLTIRGCPEMVKVISDEEEVQVEVVSGGERAPLFLFPKLQELQLGHLYKLVSFCECKCDIELPSLSKVIIYSCRNMKNFSFGPLITPNLTIVEIDSYKYGAAKDLNDALQQKR